MGHNLLIILALLLLSCGQNPRETGEQVYSEKNLSAPNEDFFPHKVAPERAQHFSMDYHGNYKVVKTHATFYPNEKEEETRQDILLLVQKGTNPPPLEGPLRRASLIYIPVETVAVNVQHSESFLRELGLEDRINAIGGLYSYNNSMRNKALSGEIGQIGYSWHSPPNMEVLLERNPEVFLMTLASMDHTTSLDKCRQLDIPTAAVFDWAEKDYLARAEWVKFYSLFFNAEEKANKVFQEIAQRIDSLKTLTSNLESQESAIWGFYTSKQRWVMQISSFPAQYMRDAGLKNILLANTQPNANGQQTLTTEELLLKGKNADHWVIGDIHAGPLPQEELMNTFDAWRTDKLYHNLKRVEPKSNAADWYATAIVRPDTVLADLIKLVHPHLLPDYTPIFMGYYDKKSQGAASSESE